MFVSRSIHTNHADLIHDVAYDFYGRRMATCSSDQLIKIWDLQNNGEWVCTASWRSHLGSALRVSWAHPEFGQVIATCSFDCTIIIWEEVTSGQPATSGSSIEVDVGAGTQQSISGSLSNPATHSSNTKWIRRADLVDSHTSVTDVKFSPRHLGLQLAAISSDGMLRIYEALDVMNLTQWRLQFDFGTKMTGSCLSWSQSRLDPPLIAVGSSSSTNSLQNDTIDTLPSQSSQQLSNQSVQNTNSFINTKLVLYEYSEVRRHWDLVEFVHGLDDPIYDLAFAPHMGQSYHTLAVGSKEVYIIRIRPSSSSTGITSKLDDHPGTINAYSSTRGNASSIRSAYEIRLMAHFDHHNGRVWRVSWNVTGSLLASSGDDGCVRLWQTNYLGLWLPVSVISPDGSHCDTTITTGLNEFRNSSLFKSNEMRKSQQQQQQQQQSHSLITCTTSPISINLMTTTTSTSIPNMNNNNNNNNTNSSNTNLSTNNNNNNNNTITTTINNNNNNVNNNINSNNNNNNSNNNNNNQNKSNEPVLNSDRIEQLPSSYMNKNTFDRSVHGFSTPYQKLSSMGNGNQSVAWH